MSVPNRNEAKGGQILSTLPDASGKKLSADERLAHELADILMRQALDGGPLARIRELTRLCKILRMVVKLVTERRDREAYALTAIWPHRKIAELSGVTRSTMQGWVNSGAKVRSDSEQPDAG